MAEMPQMLVTATPSEAISQNFTRDQGFRVPLSSVPIPTARPVLFEETSTPTGLVYRAVRKPLAYAENSGDGPSVLQFAAFARNYETKFSYLGDNPDGTVKMELGRIEDQFSMQFLANLFKSAGNLNLADEYNLAVLTTNEYYANAVLAFAREIGLLQVKIR